MNHRELFRFDPRTVLIVIVILNVVMFSVGFTGPDVIVRGVFTVIPAIMAVGIGRPLAALVYLVTCGLAIAVEQSLLAMPLGGLGLLISGVAGLVARLAPGLFLAYVAIVSIRVSELMSALERWRVPRQVVIPLTVVFRFIPTVKEELSAVTTAMTARGLSLAKTGPAAWVEYRLVPLMISIVKTGEELTQAALTRGLGKPGRAQRLSNPALGWHDAAVLTVCGRGGDVVCQLN